MKWGGAMILSVYIKEKFMTESEQLKKNTEVEFANQRMAELTAYIDKTFNRLVAQIRWQYRSVLMDLACFVMYFVSIIALTVYEVPELPALKITHYATLVLWFSIGRTLLHTGRVAAIQGEIDGIFNTLEILGMISHIRDEDGAKRTKKRKSLFPRFKEFFERIGQMEQKKAPQGV